MSNNNNSVRTTSPHVATHVNEWLSKAEVIEGSIDRLSPDERLAYDYIRHSIELPAVDRDRLQVNQELLREAGLELNDDFGAAVKTFASKVRFIISDFEEFRNLALTPSLSDSTPDIITPATTGKHNVGDLHPNGKWIWLETSPGKYDWRVIGCRKHQEWLDTSSKPSSKPPTAPETTTKPETAAKEGWWTIAKRVMRNLLAWFISIPAIGLMLFGYTTETFERDNFIGLLVVTTLVVIMQFVYSGRSFFRKGIWSPIGLYSIVLIPTGVTCLIQWLAKSDKSKYEYVMITGVAFVVAGIIGVTLMKLLHKK